MTNIKSLSAIEKKQLLEKLMSEQSDSVQLASLGQTRLWLLNELINSSLYNINTALHIKGKLDIGVLQSSLIEIVKRHSSLRTTLPNIKGEPHQVVTSNFTKASRLIELDYSNDKSINSNDFINIIKKEVNMPFSLHEGPLFKTKLFKFKNNNFVLVFIMHHAISDGWSTGILIRDFIEIYNKKMNNIKASLNTLDYKYTDFSKWQRKTMLQKSFQEKIDFWSRKLNGNLPVLQLPTDYPRPAKQTYNGDQIEFMIDGDILKKVKEYCRKYNITLFMFLLGAFKSMLYKYTNQNDLVIGIPVANREKTEFEDVMGYFGNTIALRSNINGDMSFKDILELVKEVSLEAFENQEVPFEKVVEAVNPERNEAYPPIFQSMFVLQNDPINFEEINNITYDILDIHTDTSKYDITLKLNEKKGSLIGIVEYNTDLFKQDKVKCFIETYTKIIKQILKDSNQLLKSFQILNEMDNKIVQEKQHNFTTIPKMKSVQDVFLDIVKLYGEKTALHSEQSILTYQQLENRSNKLANFLIEQGANTTQKIGIFLKRSSYSVEAILAILKAGCSYVPIDPDYPLERINEMMEDSEISLILSDERTITFKTNEKIKLIDMNYYSEQIASRSDQRPDIITSGEDIAYVMYTSGSTGTPKGVEISHKSIIRLVKNTNYHDFSENEVFLLFSTLSFDASTFEIFGSLLNGCKLVVFPPDLPTLDDLSIFIKQQNISTIFLTVGLFQQLEDEHINNMKGLTKLLTGGDTMPLAVAKKFVILAPNTILMNVYGPTENTTFSTFYKLSQNENWNSPIPIGKAISNTTLYILDKDLNLLPDKVPGELYLGGQGVSKGYLKRDELNQEKFINNPFVDFEDPILYKTGDRVQRQENGDLEFLGRIDNQVKVRGFRVEIGEIEHVLSRHNEIKEVVVTIRPSVNAIKQLVAYVVSNLSSESIRDYLTETIPNYMIPSHIINVKKFPLKINGKVDIQSLPEPSPEVEKESFDINQYSASQLWFSEIWSEYLGINKSSIGLDNDFFELGGDSILAIQIISKINKGGYKLSPKHLLENRTIRKLVDISQHYIGENKEYNDYADGEIPLMPIQKWFFEQELPDKNHFNMSQLYEMNIDKNHLEHALRKVINHHDAFRIRFTKTDRGYNQYYQKNKENYQLVSYIDISNESRDKQELILAHNALELQKSINIYNGPLIKCLYLKRSDDENDWLFVTAHHLIMDGISWRIFNEDLISAYNNSKEGIESTLLKTSTYKKWAENLKEYAQSDQLKRDANYWLKGLTEKPSAIPTDYGKRNTRESTATVTKVMNINATKLLLSDVHKTYSTQINDILLTSLVEILRNWTKKNEVLINLEGHGRENESTTMDISRTIGWFTSIFPIEISSEESFNSDIGASIKSVKEQLRKVPKKGWSYGLARYILEDKDVQNGFSNKQDAEISFNYLGRFSNGINAKSIAPSKYHVNSDRTSLGMRAHLIEINCSVQDDQLVLNWTYSKNKHKFETIDNIASQYINVLEKVINHCIDKLLPESTPSDFPLATLNQTELDYIEEDYAGKIENIWDPSPMQEGMLFHTLYDEKKSMYYVQSCIDIHGKLDSSLFNRAWNILISKNDILRSHFIWERIDRPLLLVNKNTPFQVEINDRNNYSEEENDIFYENLITMDRKESIDLLNAPLMKVRLVKYNGNFTRMIWGYHHAIMDGWTYTLIINDLMKIYKYLKSNEDNDSLKRPSFGNYLAWRKEKEKKNGNKDFWSRELKGLKEPTSLSIEKTNKEGNIYTNNTSSLVLSTEETQLLNNSARIRKVSLNTLCLGSWALLVSKYSKSNDIIFGVTGSGRSTEIINSEDIVGLFINTLPMRINFENDIEIGSWLRAIQNKQWELREYEHSSLSDIKEWSEMESSTPLFNQIFVFENYPSIDKNIEKQNELVLENKNSIEHTNYPMSITIKPGKQIEFEISYVESEYSSESISRILTHLKNVALELSNNTNSSLNDIKMLGEEEKYKIINDFNHEIRLPERECNIISIFETAAKENPYKVAIKSGTQCINYNELNEKSNLLAFSLIRNGVKKNDFIGLSMNKSIDLFVGLLGILKSGAAYVPIDPTLPKHRISHMITDSNIKLIISNDEVLNELKKFSCNLLTIAELSLDKKLNKLFSLPNINSNDVCYVNYTSGSTGKPKGVMVTHGNLVNMYRAWEDVYKLSETNSHLQMANLSFDVFTGDWVRALCSGKKLVLCEKIQLMDPKSLYNLMKEERVDIGEFVPVVLRTLISYLNTENKSLDFMKLVICGSDSWYTSEYNLFQKFMGSNTRLINSFGLTEATIDSSYYEGKELSSEEEKLVPIGKPFNNQQMFILDENQELLPINVSGELYIGGAGVSKGYVNNEKLNKKSFFINPWDKNNKSFMYKTGDMARFLENGNVELLGRTDSQVKVRGFRIEIGEIELALKRHPLIDKAVVVVQTENKDNKVIVGFIQTSKSLSKTDYTNIKEFLADYLPWYMIPSFIKELKTIPLTPNGKIDKLSLPSLREIKSQFVHSYSAPITDNEKKLQKIWEEILNIESPSIEEDFYNLGGNSLLAIQLTFKIKKHFKADINIKDVMKFPTITSFAKLL